MTYSGAVQMTFFGFMGAFALNWPMLAIAMLGMGFSYGVLIDASMTLACETAGKKYRIVQTLAFQWSLALQVFFLHFSHTYFYLIVHSLLCCHIFTRCEESFSDPFFECVIPLSP